MADCGDDFVECHERFERIEHAVALGLAQLRRGPRPAVAAALGDTVVEAARVCETGLLLAAEDDLWSWLCPATALWDRLGALTSSVQAAGLAVPEPEAPQAEVAGLLRRLHSARDELSDRLAAFDRYPRDRATAAGLDVAIADLQAAGDRMVAIALETDGTTRLDAAVAVLTAVAATAGRAHRRRAQGTR
ncbi:MAG: hypothetical protein H0V05_18580 [Euzebyaceae bacterium]|nr:hypothetical protein [Euzebyaceae bacterium]